MQSRPKLSARKITCNISIEQLFSKNNLSNFHYFSDKVQNLSTSKQSQLVSSEKAWFLVNDLYRVSLRDLQIKLIQRNLKFELWKSFDLFVNSREFWFTCKFLVQLIESVLMQLKIQLKIRCYLGENIGRNVIWLFVFLKKSTWLNRVGSIIF